MKKIQTEKTISVADFWRMLGSKMCSDSSKVEELVEQMTADRPNKKVRIIIEKNED